MTGGETASPTVNEEVHASVETEQEVVEAGETEEGGGGSEEPATPGG